MRSITVRRIALLVWCLTLVFGISFTSAQAATLHSTCEEQCDDGCDGNCGSAMSVGCSCFWRCTDGTSGNSICTA